MSEPKNKSLYERVKREAKKRFNVWPSAYGSAWLVREYKRRGGTYSGRKKSADGLKRWFAEKWIDVCQYPRIVKCGRPKGGYNSKSYQRKYPYCRPLKRVNKSTPKTVKELTSSQRKSRCKRKRSNPRKIIR